MSKDLKNVLNVYYEFLNRNELSWWDYDFYDFLDDIMIDYAKKGGTK